jgi:hypothetical protein
MPNKGLQGLLPEVDLELPGGQEGRDLATLLCQGLGVHEALPDETAGEWAQWLNVLPERVTRTGIGPKKSLEAIRSLYEQISRFDQPPPGVEDVDQVPCRIWADGGDDKEHVEPPVTEAVVLRPKETPVFWMDKHYIANKAVKTELLKQGLPLFILELEMGRKAAGWLGVRPLSEAVEVAPSHCGVRQEMTEQILIRVQERHPAIQALARLRNAAVPAANAVAFEALEISVSTSATNRTRSVTQEYLGG